jgi:hypothetical protein
LRIFSPSPLFSRLLNCFWKDCKYLGDGIVKVRYMVSWAGMSCFSVNIVFGSVWCSCVKLAMSTQSSALAVMAKKAMPIILFRGYLVLPCWRVS